MLLLEGTESKVALCHWLWLYLSALSSLLNNNINFLLSGQLSFVLLYILCILNFDHAVVKLTLIVFQSFNSRSTILLRLKLNIIQVKCNKETTTMAKTLGHCA